MHSIFLLSHEPGVDMRLLKSRLLLLILFVFASRAAAQNANAYQEISGIYTGSIPCTDCQGIQYRLSLFRDGNYEESVTYQGRSLTPITFNGTYIIVQNSILQLNGESYSMGQFRISPAALQMLDVNGNEITGKFSERYVLHKLTRSVKTISDGPEKIITAPADRKKFSHGITFYASGNEPFWSLDISEGNFIKLNTADGFNLNTPYVNGIKAMDANVSRYYSQTESGTLQIQIQQQRCIDGMSGIESDYKVAVEAKYAGENELRHFEGCGTQVPDFNLEGKWTLKKLGGEEIDGSKNQQTIPYFEINLDSFNYTGNGGCNPIAGKIETSEKGLIRFEDGALTMMACPEMEMETAFLDALKKTTAYTLLNDELILSNPGKMTLVMSKATEAISLSYRLIDIWVLENMNGEKVDPKDYRSDLPRLEINSEMNFTGTTGCNNISGKLEAGDQMIKMTIEKMTRMACTNSAAETAFVDAVNNATTYSIGNNKLSIMQDGKITLIFKKVD
ncbi:MAG: META domain-containing protein [Chitinophagales bacterium]